MQFYLRDMRNSLYFDLFPGNPVVCFYPFP